MLVTYTALEQDYLNKITEKPVTFDVSTSFSDVSIFLFTTFFAVIVAAAFGRYVMAGVYRIQASEAGIRKSNETIKRVTLGLLGVFGLFLVLYTVNRGFLESDINLDGLRIGGGVVSGGNNPVVTNNPGTGNQSGTGNQTPANGNEKAVRDQLNTAGVAINKTSCPTDTSTGCTNVGGVSSSIIDAVITLRKQSGCNVTVTGGSEKTGHTSDSNHYKGQAVDIARNGCLDTFLGKQPPYGKANTYSFSGLGFWFEDSAHYHVSPSGR